MVRDIEPEALESLTASLPVNAFSIDISDEEVDCEESVIFSDSETSESNC